MLVDAAIPHIDVADAVNDELGPEFTTTESSVRRARQKLPAEQDAAKNTRNTFTEKDRETLHERLDLLLDKANVSPGEVQGLRVSQWDGMIKDANDEPVVTTLYGVNLNVRKFDQSQVQRVPSLDELALIRDYRSLAHTYTSWREIRGTLVVALGDLQVGKVNAESGTAELWDRVRATTAEIIRHIRSTRRRPEKIILLHAGDCIEGYTSQGGRLIKKQDLYLTAQVDAYQRMLEFQVLELAPLCDRLDVAVVPGNHDETTRDFETSTDDSWALFAARNALRFIQAADVSLAEKVVWHFPGHEKLAVEFNVGSPEDPFYLTMLHGHRVATNANTIMRWWRDATFGNQPGAKSRILVTGHFHHYRSETAGDGKTWIQVPNMDGGSAWFANKRGDDTPPGMVTFWLDQTKQYPIRNLIVHSEELPAA